MTVSDIALARYTTKIFDAARRIDDAVIEDLIEALRLAPSSVNSQPWHFVVAASPEGRERIAKAMPGAYAYNAPKVRDASHVVVFCARVGIDKDHLDAVLSQETADGRFPTEEAKTGQRTARAFYTEAHRFDRKDLQVWIEKQVYLALGSLLTYAASLKIDACPMEGFDSRLLDEELGLRAKGLTSLVVVGLGYRAENDFNARLPKSRLPAGLVISRI